jgi:hypothetical protein
MAEILLYMHNGAPTYSSRAVRVVLNNSFREPWIGRGGPTTCPPRSPDFHRLEFYLCGLCMQILLISKLHHSIEDACETIYNYLGIFERIRRSLMRRVEACFVSHGGHFEHL